MEQWVVVLLTAVGSILASTGFWTFLQKRLEKKSLNTKMLIGLAHDRIIDLGIRYIERGIITHDELENLLDYLYEPYKAMGGNGSAEQIVGVVKRLRITNALPTWPEVERRKNGCYSKKTCCTSDHCGQENDEHEN